MGIELFCCEYEIDESNNISNTMGKYFISNSLKRLSI